MTTRIAINGFGRIGRLVLRAFAEHTHNKEMEIVAINDLGSLKDNAHLFKYDSVHGPYGRQIATTDDTIDVGFGPIKVFSKPNPRDLPWGDLGIDIVLECSGHFASREGGQKHLEAGAKRVLISAPAGDVDHTVVYGVNHETLKADHKIISNASCTTNCLAPIAAVLHEAIGIENGYMTTIHAYTADQRLVDSFHSDPRRARAAAQSMIPTSTGAAKAVGLVLPDLKGKLDGTAIRVPTPNVSVVDLTFNTKRDTTVAEINDLVTKAANGSYKGVIGLVDEPLVSVDFNHNPYSSNFDLTQTQTIGPRFARILSWYDNEWGFSNRMLDVAHYIGSL
jgi:glyceraldehyde 3-phosphate dehydrogenase